MIYILAMLNLMCFVLNYLHAGKYLFNPAVVYTFSFTFFSFLCCIANLYMGIDINDWKTIFFIVFGDVAITVACWKQNKISVGKTHDKTLKINWIFSIIAVITLIITMYVQYEYIMAFGASAGGGDFFECAVKYKIAITFQDADDMKVLPPFYLGYIKTISSIFGYVFMLEFFYEKICRNRTHWLYIIIIILYLLYSMMNASRSEAFHYITAMAFIWYFFTIRKKGMSYNRKILKLFAIMTVVLAIFMVSFVYITGRTQNDVDIDYMVSSIFVYAGAPIFNLDTYLSNPWLSNKNIFGAMTFIRLINWMGGKFDISNLRYPLDLPFLSYGNYNLGNVYTTYYAFYYDFQFIGTIILTIVMAIICAVIYRLSKKQYRSVVNSHFMILLYAIIVNNIVMLPFSNRIFEWVNIGTFYQLIGSYIFIYLLYGFRRIKIT